MNVRLRARDGLRVGQVKLRGEFIVGAGADC